MMLPDRFLETLPDEFRFPAELVSSSGVILGGAGSDADVKSSDIYVVEC